jgi:multimeric flavodoxin WrbA
MKIINILGSPRTKGNTAKVLSMFEDNVGEKHEIEQINIARHFCLVSDAGTPDHDSLISGKPAALLVSCAGPFFGLRVKLRPNKNDP